MSTATKTPERPPTGTRAKPKPSHAGPPNSTPDAKTCQQPPALLISSRQEISEFFTCCPHAQTLTAWSDLLQSEILIPLGCRQWSCRYCAELKIKQLSAKTRDAKPNRMLTLTVDPKLWESPRAAFDGTRSQVPELVRRLRKQFGEVEYLRVTELTKNGWPHYHMLIRSGYLPHTLVKDHWAELTGATIVDLRQVKKTFAAYKYLVKYLSKLHKIEWTERHVSYSRSFFRPDPRPPKPDLKLSTKNLHNFHPVTVCLEYYELGTLRKLDQTLYTVTPNLTPQDW